MALPILDGNQSATTLSTIFTAGAHIPAHTVVSLGSQAISDITSGVSGSVVSISNFPASTVVSAYGIGSDGTWRGIEMKPGSNRLLADATISGTVPISISSVTVGNSLTISSLPAISGTVTVGALPSGSLTTRFGSVVTANESFITSAVTNTSRKYLLAQNISAGTVTIGIGFSPTTTQGIQLTAGGGLTFDAFCPTGAVYWLGAVTGAAFTILEG